MEIPKLEELNCSTCTSRSMKVHYPEFYEYLLDTYPEDLSWTERLYWYYHGLIERPKCPVCGKDLSFNNLKLGYREFCSNKCLGKSEDVKNRRTKSVLKHYGVDNPMHSEVVVNRLKQNNLQKYGVENPGWTEESQEKIKKTNLERYGVEHPQQSEEIRKKSKQSNLEKYGYEYNSQSPEIKKKKKQHCQEKYGVEAYFQCEEFKEKSKETCLKRFGVDNYGKTQEYRDMMQAKMPEIRQKMAETCMERYGVDNYSKTDEYKSSMNNMREDILKKQYDTKKANGTFNTSQIEEDFAMWLTENNIKFERQHRDPDRYPFNCDFYFPDKDLFLEIQGSWVHGGHPFDPSNSDDIEYLSLMESKHTNFYDNAIETWTIRDPLKRETAKKNNLNWIEVFSIDLNEVIEAYEHS